MRPVVLDVTRTLSPKSITSPTGVDRVERAYLKHFLSTARPILFISKMRRGIALFDRTGMANLQDRILGKTDWGPPDLRALLRGFAGRVEATMRRHAIWIGPLLSLPDHLPAAPIYLNVGHSNLDAETLSIFRNIDAKIIGLVHDTIPLDFPQFQTPASVEKFEDRMRALSTNANLIITTSEHGAKRCLHWFERWGHCPEIATNYLGIDTRPHVSPKMFDRPTFVQLGTIEPRKNHALLLDIWEQFQNIQQAERPVLHIIGRRGWLNEDVFHRLDTAPFMGRDVIEHGTCTDDEITEYIAGANALLFPSFAEGFGLPLFEALALGTKVIASDLPVFQELADGQARYLDPNDRQSWKTEILKATETNSAPPKALEMPNWGQHFALVETHL